MYKYISISTYYAKIYIDINLNPVMIFISTLDTELFHVLGPDHAGPVTGPGMVQLPHLAPGEGGGVKLQDGGDFMRGFIDASCMRLQ